VGYVCRIVSFNVGVVVCISLPLVSLWANNPHPNPKPEP
jgi:hypothetical protein